MSSLIPVGAWLWDKYGKTVVDKTAGAVKGRWNEFKWNDAAEKYRDKIKKLYGTMQIMGMARPVPLDDIFTDAYMLDKPTAFVRFDIERLKQLSNDPEAPPQAERINGLRLVVEKGNLFILGKPGAGKTTFLKYIAVKAAEQTINKVPIFISLKEWADSGAELMNFIAERFDICDFPDARPFVEELLKSGSAIVLFDGLDEVNQEDGQRDKQTRAMNNFIEKYDRTQCLITCRIAASDYSFKPFTYVEIADFTEKQIEKFVTNWFRREGEKDEETCKRFLTEFQKEDNKGLRDLARTPLLLTLLCLAFNETLTFPQRRVEIYQEALDALLKKWDSSRRIKRDEVYRKLSLGHRENMLARIAAETFEKNQYFIPQAKLEKLITDYARNVPPHDTDETTDGETILKAIEAQHGIFVERARKIYSFSHLTFQEYFTAKYIFANVAKGTLTNLVKEHCTDERWREVFLLTTSLLPDANQFMITFRRFINDLLGEDETVIALLMWADKKSALTQTDSELARAIYLRMRLMDTGRVVRYSRTKTRDFDNNAVDNAIDNDFEIQLDWVFFALARWFDRKWYPKVLACARKLGLNELTKELQELAENGLEAFWVMRDSGTVVPRTVAKSLHDTLLTIMFRHRNLVRWLNLTAAQEERVVAYFNATSLLEDCLELAFMPPDEKKAMLNSLYLPPAQADEGQNA
jgi:NACHT domain